MDNIYHPSSFDWALHFSKSGNLYLEDPCPMLQALFILLFDLFEVSYPDLWVFVVQWNWTSAPKAPPPRGYQGNGSQKFFKNQNYRINYTRENCWIWLLLSLNSVRLINSMLFAENNFTLWVAFGFLFPFVYIIFFIYFISLYKQKKKKGPGLLAYGLGTSLACDDTLRFSDANSTRKAPTSWIKLTSE